MAHLKSRTNCPPNGFQYRQPETGWHTEAWDFNSIVVAVVNHRRSNSRFSLNMDPAQVAEDVDVQNAARCLSMQGGENYVVMAAVGEQSIPKPSPLRKLAAAAAGFVGGANQIKAGVQVLYDWLGGGADPVAPELATQRAEICARCPLNDPGDWRRHFTGPIAERIRLTLEVRKDMKLATEFDDAIGVCSACACPLRLKVHVPISFIEAHTSTTVRQALDEGCWMLKEGLTNDEP